MQKIHPLFNQALESRQQTEKCSKILVAVLNQFREIWKSRSLIIFLSAKPSYSNLSDRHLSESKIFGLLLCLYFAIPFHKIDACAVSDYTVSDDIRH